MNKMYNLSKLIMLVVLLAGTFSAGAQSTTFSFSLPGSVRSYTVPAGVYALVVTAKGAQGGTGNGVGVGGRGAIMTGTFNATPGHVLKVIAGQQAPLTTNHYQGGGGGGSFVWNSSTGNTLWVAAGGGGGGGYTAGTNIGMDAVTTADGTVGNGTPTYGGNGVGGNGATAPAYVRYAGGGAGWLSNGNGGFTASCSLAGGGVKPLSGGTGGTFGGNALYDGSGGFGGGGGAQGNCTTTGGGGGGGYSGGAGGAGSNFPGGGGGGSFNGGMTVSNSVGNLGDGVVIITAVCLPPSGGAIVGPSSVCLGSSYAYTNPTATPDGIWASTDPSILTINPVTGVASALAAGIDTITYTRTLTCGTASAIRVITVNPLPAPITGTPDICVGTSTTLMDATPGGTWSSINTAVGTINSTSGSVTGIAVGNTIISYTLPTLCAVLATVNVVGVTNGSTKVCNSDTIQLHSSIPSGTWTSTNTGVATVGSTGIVTGASLGVVSIVFTPSSGCAIVTTVTVNPKAPITGVDSVCVGLERYLANIVGGGIWSSSFPGIADVTFDSGKVHGFMAGITTISYLLPTGCLSTVSYNVIDFPPAIGGTMTACPGSSTALTDAVGGGYWTSGNNLIATIVPSTGVLTGVAADTVRVYYTISPGCTIATTVTINPLPEVITGNDVICPSTKDTLYDASLYGVWSSTTPGIATVDFTGVVTAIHSGSASIRYTLPLTGCYRTKIVTIDALPVPLITYNFLYGTLYATPGYDNYQWFDSSYGKIVGATTESIAATHTTYYYVEVTDSNGCKGRSAAFLYDIALVNVGSVAANSDVKIFPNPASGIVNIESHTNVRAEITSLDGRVLISQANAKQVDISSLANGLYIISLYSDAGSRVMVQKLTKE